MSLNLPIMVKDISGLMELFSKSTKLTFLSPMIWIMNMGQKRFKETHIKSQFISPNVQLSNGEKISKSETWSMLLILLEVGIMQLLLEYKKNKTVEEEFKSLSKFIIKMEIKLMKMENILVLQITKKNMMPFQLRLHHIVLSQKSSVTNLRSL